MFSKTHEKIDSSSFPVCNTVLPGCLIVFGVDIMIFTQVRNRPSHWHFINSILFLRAFIVVLMDSRTGYLNATGKGSSLTLTGIVSVFWVSQNQECIYLEFVIVVLSMKAWHGNLH